MPGSRLESETPMTEPLHPDEQMRHQVAALYTAILGDAIDPSKPGILRRLERLEQHAMWVVRGVVGFFGAMGAIAVAAVVHFFGLNK